MSRSFNGSANNYIDIPNKSAYNISSITISLWVYPTAFTNAYNTTFFRFTNAAFYWPQILLKSTGKVAWYVEPDNSGVGLNIDPGSNTLSTNTWYNLIATYSAGAGLNGYVNGSSDGSAASDGRALSNQTTDIILGGDTSGLTRWHTGRLADVGVWSTVLGTGEITALGNGARPYTIRQSSLVGYWPLDGLQSPEPDFSGNAANGTLTGTVTSAAGPPVMQFTSRWPQSNSIPISPPFNAAWAVGSNRSIEGVTT